MVRRKSERQMNYKRLDKVKKAQIRERVLRSRDRKRYSENQIYRKENERVEQIERKRVEVKKKEER